MQESNTRQKILLASRMLFAEKGFHKAKIEEIAEAAGVGKGTIYDYFKSKKELFETMIKDIANEFKSVFIEKIGEEKDFESKLKRLAQLKFEINKSHIYIESLVFKNLSSFDEELVEWLKDFREEMIGFIEGIICEGVKCGHIKDVNPKLAALIYLGGAHLLSHYICEQEKDEYESMKNEGLELLHEITFRGLGK